MSDSDSDTVSSLDGYTKPTKAWGRNYKARQIKPNENEEEELPEEYRIRSSSRSILNDDNSTTKKIVCESKKITNENLKKIGQPIAKVEDKKVDEVHKEIGTRYDKLNQCQMNHPPITYGPVKAKVEKEIPITTEIEYLVENPHDMSSKFLPSAPFPVLTKIDKDDRMTFFQYYLKVYIGYSGVTIRNLYTYRTFEMGMLAKLKRIMPVKLNSSKSFRLYYFNENGIKFPINSDADYVAAMYIHGIFNENQYKDSSQLVILLQFDDPEEEEDVAAHETFKMTTGELPDEMCVRLPGETNSRARFTFLPALQPRLDTSVPIIDAIFKFYDLNTVKLTAEIVPTIYQKVQLTDPLVGRNVSRTDEIKDGFAEKVSKCGNEINITMEMIDREDELEKEKWRKNTGKSIGQPEGDKRCQQESEKAQLMKNSSETRQLLVNGPKNPQEALICEGVLAASYSDLAKGLKEKITKVKAKNDLVAQILREEQNNNGSSTGQQVLDPKLREAITAQGNINELFDGLQADLAKISDDRIPSIGGSKVTTVEEGNELVVRVTPQNVPPPPPLQAAPLSKSQKKKMKKAKKDAEKEDQKAPE